MIFPLTIKQIQKNTTVVCTLMRFIFVPTVTKQAYHSIYLNVRDALYVVKTKILKHIIILISSQA